MAAHQYAQAAPLLVPANVSFEPYGYWAAADQEVTTAAYAAAEALPPGVPVLRGYRATWWTFTPGAGPADLAWLPAPQLSCYVFGTGAVVPAYVDVWRLAGGVWTLVGQATSNPAGGDNRGVVNLSKANAGQVHYLRVAVVDTAVPEHTHAEAYYLFPAPEPTHLAAPPADLGVDAPAPRLVGMSPLHVAAPPADLGIDAPPPTVPATGRYTLTVPPADLGIDAPPPQFVTATAAAVAPSGITVPGVRPAFTVATTTPGPGMHVEVQYATDQAFTTGLGTATADAPPGLDDAQVSVPAGADLPAGVLWWRARIVGPLGAGDWSAALSFNLDPADGQALAAGSLTVTRATTPAPHLWYIDHDLSGTDAGEQLVLIGAGFGPDPQVLLGDQQLTVTASAAVDADPDATATVIDPGVVCTPWHEQITATIPPLDADSAGDAITVQRT